MNHVLVSRVNDMPVIDINRIAYLDPCPPDKNYDDLGQYFYKQDGVIEHLFSYYHGDQLSVLENQLQSNKDLFMEVKQFNRRENYLDILKGMIKFIDASKEFEVVKSFGLAFANGNRQPLIDLLNILRSDFYNSHKFFDNIKKFVSPIINAMIQGNLDGETMKKEVLENAIVLARDPYFSENYHILSPHIINLSQQHLTQ